MTPPGPTGTHTMAGTERAAKISRLASLFGIFFVILGLGLAFGGILMRAVRVMSLPGRTAATVMGYMQVSQGTPDKPMVTEAYPQVHFQVPGHTDLVNATSKFSEADRPWAANDTVTAAFDPQNPQDAEIVEAASYRYNRDHGGILLGLLVGAAGVLCLGIGWRFNELASQPAASP